MARKGSIGALVVATLVWVSFQVAPEQSSNVITNLAFWKSTRDMKPVNEMVGQTCSNDPESIISKPNLHCEPLPTTTTTAPR